MPQGEVECLLILVNLCLWIPFIIQDLHKTAQNSCACGYSIASLGWYVWPTMQMVSAFSYSDYCFLLFYPFYNYSLNFIIYVVNLEFSCFLFALTVWYGEWGLLLGGAVVFKLIIAHICFAKFHFCTKLVDHQFKGSVVEYGMFEGQFDRFSCNLVMIFFWVWYVNL